MIDKLPTKQVQPNSGAYVPPQETEARHERG